MLYMYIVQITIEVTDGKGKTAEAVAIIDVARDEQPPVFDGVPYTPGIVSENARNNSGVYTVRASDPDLKVIFSFITIC